MPEITLNRSELAAAMQLLESWDNQEATFEVPNMDDVFEDDLLAYEHIFSQLAHYARTKRQAMILRVRGEIESAIALERECDRTYALLPQWAKW